MSAEMDDQIQQIQENQENSSQQNSSQKQNKFESDNCDIGQENESSLNDSIHSAYQNSESNQTESIGAVENYDGIAPNSSRGSTKATGDDDYMSIYSNRQAHRRYFPGDRGDGRIVDDEPERDEDGSLNLTNKYLRELFKKEWKKYYRTPELNEKLFLHFKGFSYMKNLGQFKNLKCLYFEGNGCKSLKGLEECTEMRTLFIQENIIETIEGLDTLTQLRTLNLSDNMVKKVTGLKNCIELDSLYLKRNRLGQQQEGGDIGCLQGLLERPTLSCIDLSDNYLSDPAILPEIFEKMPDLKVLYLQNNPVCKKIPSYRKTVIARIPTLTYLDDRPVFEEDRRRAEAFAAGGIEAEREEMKKIKKENSDKHWANHEAFQLMIKKAREEKAEKQEQKESMKEMLAKAKAEKEAKKLQENMEGIYKKDDEIDLAKDKTFFEELKEKAEKRFHEKQAGIEHEEQVEYGQFEKMEEELNGNRKQAVEQFDQKLEQEEKKISKSLIFEDQDSEYKNSQQQYLNEKEIEQEQEQEQEIDENNEEQEVPNLEDIDNEQLQDLKKQKQKEWLENICKQQEEKAEAQNEEKQESVQEDENNEVDPADIFLDEKRVNEAQKKVTKKQLEERINMQSEALNQQKQPGTTDLNELD